MFNLLIVLIVIASILLVVIVLAQNPKGGGLAHGFSSSNQFMGVQNTNKFLSKATWSLVGFIALASIISASISINQNDKQDSSSDVINSAKQEADKAQKQQAPTANPFGGNQQQAPAPAPAAK